MKSLLLPLFCTGFLISHLLNAEGVISQNPSISETPIKGGSVSFIPPTGWHFTDEKQLPSHVKTMVVGKGRGHFPPSMNLSCEPFKGTLREYLKIVKNMNSAHGYEWKDLGSIRTESGNASLSQVDTRTQWGDVRLMHVILLKEGTIYILTASALKDEFSSFYKDFFDAMRSLKVIPEQKQL